MGGTHLKAIGVLVFVLLACSACTSRYVVDYETLERAKQAAADGQRGVAIRASPANDDRMTYLRISELKGELEHFGDGQVLVAAHDYRTGSVIAGAGLAAFGVLGTVGGMALLLDESGSDSQIPRDVYGAALVSQGLVNFSLGMGVVGIGLSTSGPEVPHPSGDLPTNSPDSQEAGPDQHMAHITFRF